MVVNTLSAIWAGFKLKKCCAVLGTCMEFAMKETEDILPWEESKVWHGIFIRFHEGRWFVIGCKAHTKEDKMQEVGTGAVIPFDKLYADKALEHTKILR